VDQVKAKPGTLGAPNRMKRHNWGKRKWSEYRSGSSLRGGKRIKPRAGGSYKTSKGKIQESAGPGGVPREILQEKK